MSDSIEKLVRLILSPDVQPVGLSQELGAFVRAIRAFATVQLVPNRIQADGETRTAAGLAISPTLAGRCGDDFMRTLVFMRGLYDAIQDCGERISNRPIRVLYAGCGPYALLALPAMLVLEADRLQLELLDLHQASLESAVAVARELELENRISKVLNTDACSYRIPADSVPDIILSETMTAGLQNEPQVSIARQLHTQAPHSQLIPECVRIHACLVNLAAEFAAFNSKPSETPAAAQKDRICLGAAFELSAASIASWHDLDGNRLPGNTLIAPAVIAPRYTPELITEITVYKHHTLQTHDSGLTVFRPLPCPELAPGDKLAFSYRLGANPGLECESLRVEHTPF